MYGYADYVDVTPDQLLQKVSREQIIEFVFNEPFDLNKKYRSIFRDDKHAGCRFERRPDGSILFIDFGEKFRTGKTHRSVFSLVMDKYGVSMTAAIGIICNHFGLSVSSNDYSPIVQTTLDDITESNQVEIKYDKKIPDRSDQWFWSQSLIKLDDLKEDNVFAVQRFSVKSPGKGYRLFSPYRYCYVFDFVDTCKIYQPFSDSYKFISNCDENDIGNFDNLPITGDEVIIQKSYKDHRVLRNLPMKLNVIWFQNEGCIPSMEILKNLTDRFKLITIFFDNDYHGVMAAIKLYEVFESLRPGCARVVHLPVFIGQENRKDPSAFINKEGKEDTIKVLNYIGIYGNTG